MVTARVDSMSRVVGEVPGKRKILKTQSDIPYVSWRLWHHFVPNQNAWSQTEFIQATSFGHCAAWPPPSFFSAHFHTCPPQSTADPSTATLTAS